MMRQPCRIRGTVYPSQAAAARALGVHPQTICQALQRGTEDRIGLCKAQGTSGPHRPIMMNGTTWPSISAAARGIGVHPANVYKALAAGRTSIRWNGGRA